MENGKMKVLMLVLGNDLNTGEVKTEIMRCGEATNFGLGQLLVFLTVQEAVAGDKGHGAERHQYAFI